jgi:superfamily I DNA and/or RNA helicase
MSKNFIGNQIIGNFKINGNISTNKNLLLEKNNDHLYIVSDTESSLLNPLDTNAENILQIFSDKPKDDNESIYKLTIENDNVSVLLCTYLKVECINVPGITIYVSRIDENDYSIKLKCDINKLFDQLKEEFIYNSSVFFEQNEKNTSKPKMIGIDYNAELEQERPGVFRITKLTKNTKKNFNYLFQIYGIINFLKWDKAILVKSSEIVKLEDVKNNQIFKAWETYIDYLKLKSDTELVKNGFVFYKSFRYDGDQIEFSLNPNADIFGSELFKDYKNKEYGCLFVNEAFPTTIEEFIKYKNENYKRFVHLEKIQKIGGHNNVFFDIPNNTDKLGEGDYEGILCISDRSFNVEYRRRRDIVDTINSKKNKTANALMRLMEDDVVDTQKGSRTHPITNNVLLKMFNSNDIEVKENYRRAMDIAINTPDIAVIQGPPGTGKTTLIAGILARINEMSHKNYKVLISSEQHEALKNAVGKVAGNFVPPLITSVERIKDDNYIDQKMLIVEQFKQKLELIANNILTEKNTMRYSKHLTNYISLVQKISDNNYNNWIIEENYDNLVNSIKQIGIYDLLLQDILQLKQNIRIDSHLIKEVDPSKLLLKRKLDSQRVFIESFKDDGIYQLESLQKMLEIMELEEYKMPIDLFNELKMTKDDYDKSIFDAYVNYVQNLKKVFTEVDKNPFNASRISSKEIIEKISKFVEEYSMSREKNIEDIFEEFNYRLNDIDNVTEIIRNYSCVIGSTAAQANKSKLVADTDIYDYVIIDEASRANPLDIMIPMILGIKVVLIGDQKQLPHYIENHTVKDFNVNQNIFNEYEERHLTTSLFEVIYNNLEKAYLDDRLAYQRHIRINEQHRMHPNIGTFISNEFYEGTLANGDSTVLKVNNFNMFNGKNIAVIDIPYTEGPEEKTSNTFSRQSEAYAILNLLKQFLKKNDDKELEIGIIAYYKGQVDLINNLIEQNFPKKIINNIRCGTVDSYQGREFDIVIISGTRSNLKPDPISSLGFIHQLPSRINVSLSRAKKLLIFTGDCSTFWKTDHFKHFFEYAKKVGYYDSYKMEKEEKHG